MKKLLTILLTAVMCLSLVLPALAVEIDPNDILGLLRCEKSFEEISEKYGVSVEEVEKAIEPYIEDEYDPDTAVPFSSQLYTNLEFDDDLVIVMLKHRYSRYEIKYTVEDFPELDLVSVEAPLKKNNAGNAKWVDYFGDYKEMLILTLADPGKENVIEAVKKLEHRADDDLYIAQPNYIYPMFPCWEFLGDTNADEEVNMKDALIIVKHLAGWKLYFDEPNADANGDGEINVKDVSHILRTIANS